MEIEEKGVAGDIEILDKMASDLRFLHSNKYEECDGQPVITTGELIKEILWLKHRLEGWLSFGYRMDYVRNRPRQNESEGMMP